MDDKIKKALKVDGRFHDNLLEFVKKRVEMSRMHMNKFYDLWDANDATLRGERIADEQDQKAAKRGEPVKMILPFAYAQVQTFIAFFMMLFNQRSVFFEVQDNGEGEYTPEGDAEKILDKQLTENKFNLIQYQAFLDLARSGFCVIKNVWEEQVKEVTETVQGAPGITPFGAPVGEQTTTQTTTRPVKQLNRLVCVSPYKFLPDVRLPLSRFQEGEFCASEDEFSIVRLKQMEAEGTITNTKDVHDFTADGGAGLRRLNRLLSAEVSQEPRIMTAGMPGSGMAVVTECQIWIVPNEIKNEEGDSPLGTGEKPTLYVVKYANDKTILQVDELNYAYNEFTYDVGEYTPDQIRVINESLTELIDPLQNVATWFLNSHITSVRKVMDNKIVVDPMGIEVQDLIDRSPVIRLKEGVGRAGIDAWIKQLEVQDVTQGHVTDIQTLWGFIQTATGINENALGQYNGGRRSAAEARTVNAGAAARLKTIANVLWETLFVPMGKKMLDMLQDQIDFTVFQRYVGKAADQARFEAFKNEIYEFEFFDGTAPSEKGYIAQSMQDLLLGLLTNPMAGQMLTQEPFRSLVVEIADLRGIRSPERFLPPAQAPVPIEPIKQNNGTQPNTGAGTNGAGQGATPVTSQPVVRALPSPVAQ